MKSSKWLALMAAAIIAGGITVSSIQAAQSAGPFAQRRAALRSRLIERLGLTEEQVAKIKFELRAERETLTRLLKRLHDAHGQLRSTIQQDDVTEHAVRVAASNLAAVQADSAVERAKLHGKLSPILTADQLAQVKAFQAESGRIPRPRHRNHRRAIGGGSGRARSQEVATRPASDLPTKQTNQSGE